MPRARLGRVRFSSRSAIEERQSQLSAALDAVREQRPDALDLTLSNPTRAGLSYAAYGPPRAWSGIDAPHYVPDPLGIAAGRLAVARHWPDQRRAPDPEHILLVPSSSEAYNYVFTLLCDMGDEVLAPEPSYPLLLHLARYAGVRLEPYRLAYDGAWHIDLESVRRAFGPRTRAIVLVSPNNPTGSYTSQLELEALAELGVPLVSDEVFAHYELEPRGREPKTALRATKALTFCIDGLSKSAGLPQAKLSWLGVSGAAPEVSEAMRRLSWLSDTYLSVAGPMQNALSYLLERSASFRAPLLERLRANLHGLRAALVGSAASVLRAEGGWYAVVRLPELASEEDWVLGLLEHEGVMTHPGYFYDFAGHAPHLVVSLLVPPEAFERGALAIRRAVDRRVSG